MDSTRGVGERAVVLGASMAGLLTARVLAERFDQVTVLDRDRLDGDDARRGVAQGRHIHVLLSRGQQLVDDLFPGLTRDLIAGGVPTVDHLGDVRWYLSGQRLRRADSGLRVLAVSRPVLEAGIRDRVRQLPNVEVVDRCDAAGVATTDDRRAVVGARIIRHADGSAEQTLPADLVVDATGRGSRTPMWLDALGYRRPDVDSVEVDVGYATAVFRASTVATDDVGAIVVAPNPGHRRGGVVQLLEDDRCMVSLIGMLGDHPPTDPEEFLRFARSLQFPDVHDAIVGADRLTDPVPYRFRFGTRHRYEKLTHFPTGFLVVGDAFCSFDPIYAQGMTVAAMEATALRRRLASGSVPRPREMLRDLARIVDVPWSMAVGGALAHPEVKGRRSVQVRFGNAYIPLVHAAASDDTDVGTAFVRVSGLVDPPSALMRPTVARRVLRHRLRRSGTYRSAPPIRSRTRS